MKLRIPEVFKDKAVQCEVKGFEKKVGETIQDGDYLAELRIEAVEDDPSGCPVIYYGDLVVRGGGVLKEIRTQNSTQQGDVFAIVGEGDEDMQVDFVTF